MKKTVTIALASLLVVSPVAGIAYAQDTTAPMTSDGLATGAIAAADVSIVQISTLEDDKTETAEAERLKLKANDPSQMEKVQTELQSDPALLETLASKDVQLQNVVEIKTSATGGKIVYVK
ncbi:MAG: hypothetical protein ACT6U0_01165 [Shinella sp.]|uniref:hypothetical protein n=1 Tax=Shinella sp. TaxID=1870904 RepID=UPI0040365479